MKPGVGLTPTALVRNRELIRDDLPVVAVVVNNMSIRSISSINSSRSSSNSSGSSSSRQNSRSSSSSTNSIVEDSTVLDEYMWSNDG